MFLHLGQGHTIPIKEIVMIGNLNNKTSKSTKEFLEIAQEEGFVVDYSSAKPKSFILTDETIYLSLITARTLLKRLNNSFKFLKELTLKDNLLITDPKEKENTKI